MQQLGGQLHPHWLQKVHQLHKQSLVLVVEKGDGPTRTAQSARTTNLNGTKSVFVHAKGVSLLFLTCYIIIMALCTWWIN